MSQRSRCLIATALVLLGAAPSRAASFSVPPATRGHQDVVMTGQIEPDDDANLEAALSQVAPRRLADVRLRLDSPGGSAKGGLVLARVVLAHRLDTDVPDQRVCASACFIVFAAGRHRTAGRAAVLGVHGSAEDGVASERTDAVDVALAKVLRDLRVPDGVTRRVLSTPPDDVYVLTTDDLRAMGVTTTGRRGRR